MSETSKGVAKWWATLAVAMAAALLITWLARLAGIQLRTLLSIVAGGAGLAWAIVLVAVPWNLYFAARRVVVQMAVSLSREIVVPEANQAEARLIERRMLWFALSGHVITALAIGVVTLVSGHTIGYYFTGFYLLTATFRPAAAYFSHLRERIGVLSRESLHPRDDVVSLRVKVTELDRLVRQFSQELPDLKRDTAEQVRRVESRLSGEITHSAKMVAGDVSRVQEAQAADREIARSRDEELGRKIDWMIRHFEATLDGFSDHQELQTGLRALVRMIKADTA